MAEISVKVGNNEKKIETFGNINKYIEKIEIPSELYAGQEEVIPLIQVKGSKNWIKPILKIKFYWNNI